MDFIKNTVDERVSHVYLDSGKSNAINQQMLEELKETIVTAQVDPAIEGLILHGKSGFFSAGLDLIALYAYNEEEVRRFWHTFMDFVRTFVAFDKPAVAAISGHSPAGGCVLAICCDYRVMADGDYIIGLNEVPVGIIVPASIFQLYGFWLGEAAAYRYLLEGKLFKPQEALQAGLVDEVVDARSIRTAAGRQLAKYTQYERNTWRRSKRNMRQSVIDAFEADQEDTIEAILQQWWSPATRSIIKSIIDNLKR
ncbi:enoyl-CoA hydratase/isomerase family protein [Parapedobacter sp. ISTM3]|uniref:Enoyl-CoA hydratase/carnithine racemase n=1 Tax=Parapedobacter luteus TaxID=623280 RepID=A0A1T5D093_9SPHI|nr:MULTISPECIES: enoyl-CoA hydratase/isomerase family protein [Parapedobacter]MBK1440581.1 enoyl-CoA hydratase/isomerase family protein [Parapedobacter sp. ISTM3]SKB65001.1 Enoyl-CoA hydratase/carnithine racemase [Parapedobacter luteus]